MTIESAQPLAKSQILKYLAGRAINFARAALLIGCFKGSPPVWKAMDVIV